MQADYPLLEFDAVSKAIIDPSGNKELADKMPEKAVLCFFYDVISNLVSDGKLTKIGQLMSEIGPNSVYTIEYEGQQIAVMQPGVGAPLAAGFMEEIVACGAKKIIAVGGCGVLHADTDAGQAFVIESAVRDEGTSYHYLPPSTEVHASPKAIVAIRDVLEVHQVPHMVVKSWTTDAIYRETIDRRDQRVAQGCHVVEMEASAFFAVAQFRKVTMGQLVYGGDLVVPQGWDYRDWNDRKDDRMNLFHLAVEACSHL
ncbi:MAG: nucleoside phosphorylase [Anaerolineaceae bacterium]|nr:nucleoside phosphorylase [Anaerolineaceae bacterium]